jgi:hypothetical protein
MLNLSRDQLDRTAEVRHIARDWRAMAADLDSRCVVVANADDPMTAWAATAAAQTVWVAAGQPWTLDTVLCPACGALLQRSHCDWWCRLHREDRHQTSRVGNHWCSEAAANGAAAALAAPTWPTLPCSGWLVAGLNVRNLVPLIAAGQSAAIRSIADRRPAVRLLLARTRPLEWTLDMIDEDDDRRQRQRRAATVATRHIVGRPLSG